MFEYYIKSLIITCSKDQAAARQLMGIKGASETKNIWAIRLQLCKPVTWIPLIWGVACGVSLIFIYSHHNTVISILGRQD